MRIEDFVERLRTELIPKHYKTVDYPSGDFVHCVFRSRDLIISRYMLAVCRVADSSNLNEHIRSIREEIKNKYAAKWIFREIGLQVILVGENLAEDIPKADKFGTHAVIIQGIHVADPARTKVLTTQSEWVAVKFSRASAIAKIVRDCFDEA